MSGDVRCNQATVADAASVADFLVAQDVRPAPTAADISALLGQSETAVYVARHDGAVVGTAACLQDGACAHLVYFVIGRPSPSIASPDVDAADIARKLLAQVEVCCRDAGCALLVAQTEQNSLSYHVLTALEFSIDYAEQDVSGGQAVVQLDLIKRLAP